MWIFTIANASPTNISLLNKKVETVLEGGFNGFTLKDISVIVWALSAANHNP